VNTPRPDPPDLIASIDDEAVGAWMVTTETGSRYTVDLDARMIRRISTAGELRADGESMPLHQVVICEVGASAGFLVTVEAGMITLRLTSHVTCIEAAAPYSSAGL
jgi:hypothetical protein